MKFSFKIALRFLSSNKGQTALIALGIAIGVSVQIFIGLLIQGLQLSLVNKTIGNSPQITISSNTDDKLIDNYNSVAAKLKKSDSRIKNISLAADGPALIKNSNSTYSVLIRGMDINASDKIYNVISTLYEGRLPSESDEAIIGKELQKQLNLKTGDTIDAITNSNKLTKLKITGFYDLKNSAINKSWVITTLSTAQTLFNFGDKITSVEMQVTEPFNADKIAAEAENNLDKSLLKIDNWKDQNAQLLSALNGQSISSIMIQVFVLIAVLLGIASVLAVTVIQKSKQIGILKAMGTNDFSASLIFLFQGLLLGVIGAIAGVILGLLLCFSFSKFALNPDGTPVVALYINQSFIAFSALIAVFSAAAAALIPAGKTAKLNPIEVIKNG